jgi:hypothetical protein
MHNSLSSDSNVGCWSLREKPEAEVETWTPLPKASYAVLKDKQIRDLLAAQDLSTAGDRTQLMSRHERLALFAFPTGRTSPCSLDGLRCTTQTSTEVLRYASGQLTSVLRCGVGRKIGGRREKTP